MGEREVDQALVERVQRGDKKAFDLLVLKYQQKVANLVSRYIRDPGETLDVTQFQGRKCFLHLAVPHRHQYGEELSGRPGTQAAGQ